ncbi:WD40 repeat domain-containing protein [Pedobacter sp. SD-b]|uniref:WD40 repeat domain-containing protein n=1 Tax=Pedobacter segetis TaxID=2793069 RepID=A0ABS1BN71_9SPHI|nr:WD40 repeat domain-containing protein [Pedobacter segetis]MBK0384186.1 WD40 repeat domain-containing protein [Pedobacter segetis]
MKAKTLPGHGNPIYAVVAHPKLDLFYTAGNDKGIVEWDLISGLHTRVFNDVKTTVYSLTINHELNLLIAGCKDGSICFFDLESGKLTSFTKAGEAIFDLKYIANKKEIIASTDKGEVLILSPLTREIIHKFQSGNDKIRSLAYHEKLNLMVTVSNDEWIRIYALDDYTFVTQFRGHEKGVGSVAFTADGKFLITGGRDAHLKVWDINDWECKYSFAAHLFAIYQIAVHPNLPYFATASRDKSIKIWRTEDFSLYKNLSIDKAKEGHLLSVNDLCWSSDGNKLLSVGDDKMVKIWDFDELDN